MSEAAPIEETEEPDETTDETEEEPPDIDPDEQADVDLDALDVDPEEVEEQAGATADDADGQDDDADDQADADSPELDVPDGETWGDQYVTLLAVLLGEIAEVSDGEASKTAEDIEDLARSPPMELDDAVDGLLAQSGMGADLPPGQAVAVSTATLIAVVLLTETDIVQDILNDFDVDGFLS